MFLPLPKNINNDFLRDNLNLIIDEYRSLTYKDFIDYSCVKTGTEDLITNPQSTKTAPWQVRPLIFKYKRWPGRESMTMELLENLGVYPLIATFSRLAPNQKLETHSDHDENTVGALDTTVVKYHITLESSANDESGLIVGDETRILQQGDINCFDESTPHSAFNNGSSHRGVLLISWLRNELEF